MNASVRVILRTDDLQQGRSHAFNLAYDRAAYAFNVFTGNLNRILVREGISYPIFSNSMKAKGIFLHEKQPYVMRINEGVGLPPNLLYLSMLANGVGVPLYRLMMPSAEFVPWLDRMYNGGGYRYEGAKYEYVNLGESGTRYNVVQCGETTVSKAYVRSFGVSDADYPSMLGRVFRMNRGTARVSDFTKRKGLIKIEFGYDAIQLQERAILGRVVKTVCKCKVGEGIRSLNLGLELFPYSDFGFSFFECVNCSKYRIDRLTYYAMLRTLGYGGSVIHEVPRVKKYLSSVHDKHGVKNDEGVYSTSEAGEVVPEGCERVLLGLKGVREGMEEGGYAEYLREKGVVVDDKGLSKLNKAVRVKY